MRAGPARTAAASPTTTPAWSTGAPSTGGRTLSFDAFNKFIEDDFLNGARLNPKTDGRPDPRPDVRENAGILGDLAADFDFAQKPRPPVILPAHPAPGPASTP